MQVIKALAVINHHKVLHNAPIETPQRHFLFMQQLNSYPGLELRQERGLGQEGHVFSPCILRSDGISVDADVQLLPTESCGSSAVTIAFLLDFLMGNSQNSRHFTLHLF